MKSRFSGLIRLGSYMKAYAWRLVFVCFWGVVSTLFTVLAPFITGLIINALTEGAFNGLNFDWKRIISLLILLIVLYVLGPLFAFIQNWNMAKVTAGIIEKLRNDVSQKMHKVKLDFYDTKNHGETLSILTNDIETISNAISTNMTTIVTQVITAGGILIMMLLINWHLSLIAIALVPVSLLAAKGQMKASSQSYNRQQDLIGEMNGFIEEMYDGQAVVQTFNHQERAKVRFNEINEKLRQSSQKAEYSAGTIGPLTTLINDAGFVAVALLGSLKVIQGSMTLGSVQAMVSYTIQFAQPFSTLAGMAGSLGAANAAAIRVFDLLDCEEEIPDPENGKVPEHKKGTVGFSHVSFGYTPDHLLMKDVSIDVKPGQKAAIVGPTGAGKTTLINLLMRFYEINGGMITVDGVNTRDMTRQELRSRFGMVLQDTWLFEGTIADNLKYGRASCTDEEMIECAKAASAHSFIQTLPGGYDFMLSQGAENISQGERQLLTIARAMAADPEIMILDEATSNVDTHTEQKIQNAMAKLLKGRTSFVIAHRLSTIKDADVILYMESGDIKESGSHDELMALNGKYAQLYRSQFE
ncbi:MAG: ABC transporter ATP-binding protein [Erysipelotrichaceae bacterium]|nr:ABC transporter ATP-binding protein [Erysipelotrichaceae bacterium]